MQRRPRRERSSIADFGSRESPPAAGARMKRPCNACLAKSCWFCCGRSNNLDVSPEEIAVGIRNWLGFEAGRALVALHDDRRRDRPRPSSWHGLARCAAAGAVLWHQAGCVPSGCGRRARLARTARCWRKRQRNRNAQFAKNRRRVTTARCYSLNTIPQQHECRHRSKYSPRQAASALCR